MAYLGLFCAIFDLFIGQLDPLLDLFGTFIGQFLIDFSHIWGISGLVWDILGLFRSVLGPILVCIGPISVNFMAYFGGLSVCGKGGGDQCL